MATGESGLFLLVCAYEIKRSSQLRTLLKRVVEIGPEKKFRPVRDMNHGLCDTGAALYQPSLQNFKARLTVDN